MWPGWERQVRGKARAHWSTRVEPRVRQGLTVWKGVGVALNPSKLQRCSLSRLSSESRARAESTLEACSYRVPRRAFPSAPVVVVAFRPCTRTTRQSSIDGGQPRGSCQEFSVCSRFFSPCEPLRSPPVTGRRLVKRFSFAGTCSTLDRPIWSDRVSFFFLRGRTIGDTRHGFTWSRSAKMERVRRCF